MLKNISSSAVRETWVLLKSAIKDLNISFEFYILKVEFIAQDAQWKNKQIMGLLLLLILQQPFLNNLWLVLLQFHSHILELS